MRFKEFINQYVSVRVCGGCGRIISYTEGKQSLCPICRAAWDKAKTENCAACFQAYSECTCMPNALKRAGAHSLRKLIRYSSECLFQPQNKLIYAIKENRNRRHVGFIASEMLPLVEEAWRTLGREDERDRLRLTFLPRNPKARMRYGTDQSEEIAKKLSELSGIPYLNVFQRKRGGREQKKLSISQRQRNLCGLLSVLCPEELKGATVILVDDIVTTGASMASGVSLLKKAGARDVLCLCIAKTD